MTLTLPYPPSANRYWRKWRGRMVTSPEARAYKTKAAWLARNQGAKPYRGDVAVRAAFYRPAKRGDLDNLIKIALDALRGVAFDDDKQVVSIMALRYDDKDDPRLEIAISEAS